MDLFDFNQILDLLRVEPGHNLIQSFLLFLIWIQSRGVRKELASLKTLFDANIRQVSSLERRVLLLENGKEAIHAT